MIPSPKPGRRDVLTVEDGLEVLDARSPLADANHACRRGPVSTQELDSPPAGILDGVAGDLRRRGGDSGLVELGKAQQPGDLPRPLPGQHDVGLEADLQVQEGHVHDGSPSSMPRRQHRHVVAPSLVVAVKDAGDQGSGASAASPG